MWWGRYPLSISICVLRNAIYCSPATLVVTAKTKLLTRLAGLAAVTGNGKITLDLSPVEQRVSHRGCEVSFIWWVQPERRLAPSEELWHETGSGCFSPVWLLFHWFDFTSLISFRFGADLMIKDTWSETIRNSSVALLHICFTLTETDKNHFPKELSYLPTTLSTVEWSSSYRRFLLIKSWFVSPDKPWIYLDALFRLSGNIKFYSSNLQTGNFLLNAS